MNCDAYSENECIHSVDCFLCVNSTGDSKCISKLSKEKNVCKSANPENFMDFNYVGSVKSTDEKTKALDEYYNSLEGTQKYTFPINNYIGVALIGIGIALCSLDG